ncbi:WW domain-binding protein 2 isoform X2 [Nilaparvata lugens]|uniref:WW domain-binding protein 2 isoform X2 n=1 Tax=Nilaparvata lugens TaxID=108931 RepID=UPI000B989DA4|nr:WW domain-binding protein 2 isoform X2 [Nilaparvata lugens]
MSLNTAHANGGVLIHAGECILLFSDAVTIEFHGHPDNVFKGAKSGRLYLTTHRMIFNNKNQQDAMVSFSFPFVTLSDLELEQPVFGANFIKGKVRAQPNGNWVGEVKFRLTFKKGGAIDFGQAMLKAAHMASRSGTPADAPPPYAPPPGPWYAAPPPAYAPPPGGYYGWVPQAQAFPNAPPANSVYMTDSPPPYPGINGYNGYMQAPQNGATGFTQQPMPPADAKAAEAAQSAYYDPSKPQCAYVPPPAYYEPPPSYQETKKDQ